jgi:hypothetical protein
MMDSRPITGILAACEAAQAMQQIRGGTIGVRLAEHKLLVLPTKRQIPCKINPQ